MWDGHGQRNPNCEIMKNKDMVIIILGILVIVLLFNDLNTGYLYGYSMMGGRGFGWMWMFMFVCLTALVIFVIWMLNQTTGNKRRSK